MIAGAAVGVFKDLRNGQEIYPHYRPDRTRQEYTVSIALM